MTSSTGRTGQTEQFVSLSSNALKVVVGLATLGASVWVVGAVTLWLRLSQSPWPTGVGVEHEPRTLVVALGIKGVLLVFAIVAAIAIGVVALKQFSSKHGDLTRLAESTRVVTLGTLASLSLIVGGSFVSWQLLGAAVAVAVLFVASAWYLRRKTTKLEPPVAAAAAAGLVVAAIFAAAAFQLGDNATVQAVRFRHLPPQLAELSHAPQYLTKAPYPYFGEDGSSIYIGVINSYLPGVSPFNFCHEPRVIVELPRSDVEPLFLATGDQLSRNAESPGLQFIDWLFGTKHPNSGPIHHYSAAVRAKMHAQCAAEEANQ